MAKYILGYYDDSKNAGGTTRYLLNLLRGLNRDEFEPILFVPVRRDWHAEVKDLDAEVVTVETSKVASESMRLSATKSRRRLVTIPSRVAWTLGLAREIATLRRLFAQRRVDLLHSNNAGAEPAPIAARLAGVRRVIATWHVDSTYDLENSRRGLNYRLLEMASVRALHHIIAVSAATARDWVGRCKLRGRSLKRITVIHNGIDVIGLMRRRSIEEAKREQNFSGKLIIGSMGRLEPAKGYEYLVRALPLVLQRYPEAMVRIAGQGPLRDSLMRLSSEIGVSGQIEFLGYTKDITDFLESVDVYVQPSLCEALGLAILEASAVGVPVVASNVGGIGESVVHGETGYLIPSRNVKALSDALVTLAGNPLLRSGMAEKARRHVYENFRLDQMVAATENVYRCLLA